MKKSKIKRKFVAITFVIQIYLFITHLLLTQIFLLRCIRVYKKKHVNFEKKKTYLRESVLYLHILTAFYELIIFF